LVSLELLDHPLFAAADPDAIANVLATVRRDRVPKGKVVAGPSITKPFLILVLDGVLLSYAITDSGARVLFELIGAGGCDNALAMSGTAQHFTEAGSTATIARLAPDQVDALMDADRAVARNLFRMLAERIARRDAQLQALAFKDPGLRIAKQLLALAPILGSDDGGMTRFDFHITHQQLADMLGIRRETATIHLHELAAAGAIEIGSQSIRLSPAKLRSVIRRERVA
jgi:CRP/FNR family transcriptional regulator